MNPAWAEASSFSASIVYIATLGCLFIALAIVAFIAINKSRSFYADYEEVYKETATTNMDDMFMFIDPHRLFMVNIIAIIVFPLLTILLFQSYIIAIALFLILAFGPFQVYKVMRNKRLKRFEHQLPDALTMITGGLSAGASLNMALEALVQEQPAPLSQEFMLFIREQRIGVEFEHSIRNMERRLPIQDFLMFTAALRISRDIGGNLGETLDTLADTLRRKVTMEGKIESLTAQGRMQGYVMTALPLFLGLLLSFLEPKAMGLMFTTPIGWATIAVIVVMEVLGYIFIRQVTNIDV